MKYSFTKRLFRFSASLSKFKFTFEEQCRKGLEMQNAECKCGKEFLAFGKTFVNDHVLTTGQVL